MKKLLILVVAISLVACRKKIESVYQAPSMTPDPSKGTCTVDGIVENFDSSRATYNSSNKNFYLAFYKHGFAALNLTLNNYNWNNFPNYEQFPKGVGTYTFQMGSGTSGTFYGSFIDLSGSQTFNSSVQGGYVTITENDSANARMSGSFNYITGSSPSRNYVFMNGQFNRIRAQYW